MVHNKPKVSTKATTNKSASSGRLSFVAFCSERQKVLEARRSNLPRAEWTDDPILKQGRFCNIDRRDDFVTAELLTQLRERPHWMLQERVLLCAALRFTGSRRGEAAVLADLIEARRTETKRACTPLQSALVTEQIRCGTGTYQLSLNRKQVSTVIEKMAAAVVERVSSKAGAYADVLEASDHIAELMTVGKRPQFSANETAKDFAYIDGLMVPTKNGHRCRLGPGAKKGLTLVRAADKELHGMGDEEAINWLRTAMRKLPNLAWVEAIDVEQALCEFSKYEAYRTAGISKMKRFEPQSSRLTQTGTVRLHAWNPGAPSWSVKREQ